MHPGGWTVLRLLLKVSVFGFLLNSCSLHAEPSGAQADAKKIELLQKLADEGVVAAQRELAKLAIRQVKQAPLRSGAEAQKRLGDGVLSGDTRALQQLAHLQWITSGKEGLHTESLLMLAAAAVLGNGKAAVELNLLAGSIFAANTDLDSLLLRTINRLQRGMLFDCAVVVFECEIQDPSEWVMQQLEKNGFLLQVPNAQVLKAHIANVSQNGSVYREGQFYNFLNTVNQLNQREQEQATIEKPYEEMTWEEKRQYDRKQNRARIAQQQAQSYLDDYLSASSEQLAQFAVRFNQQRLAEAKLTDSEMLALISEGQR